MTQTVFMMPSPVQNGNKTYKEINVCGKICTNSAELSNSEIDWSADLSVHPTNVRHVA